MGPREKESPFKVNVFVGCIEETVGKDGSKGPVGVVSSVKITDYFLLT